MKFLRFFLVSGLLATGACEEARTLSDSELPESSLKADRAEHDFGRILIDGGKVETVFSIVNEAPADVQLLSVATSCGCTEAVAEFADGSTVGSFELPLDGQENDAGRAVQAGEGFKVRVVFDPAAHGPDGIGQLMREVILATRGAGQTRLVITANVVRG